LFPVMSAARQCIDRPLPYPDHATSQTLWSMRPVLIFPKMSLGTMHGWSATSWFRYCSPVTLVSRNSRVNGVFWSSYSKASTAKQHVRQHTKHCMASRATAISARPSSCIQSYLLNIWNPSSASLKSRRTARHDIAR
jgi:hypothetical protein